MCTLPTNYIYGSSQTTGSYVEVKFICICLTGFGIFETIELPVTGVTTRRMVEAR